jgi:uncharacterized protein YuzE
MNHLDINKLLKGKQPINVAIDKEARAIYFKVSDEDAARTVRMNESVSIDFDKSDEIVGVEIIRLKKIEVILKKALKDISTIIPNNILATA